MEYMDGVGLRPCVHLHISPASEYMSGTVNKVPLIFQYSSAAITRERESILVVFIQDEDGTT